MPGRKFDAGSRYRYGFNGKENDNDVKGEGNQQDYGMRIYDTRLGRFLSVDPLINEYPELTPYQFASNNPIPFIDRDGEEAAYKMPDGSIYVQPPSDHMVVPIPQEVRDKGIPISGGKPLPPNAFDRIISIALDFFPVVGEIKMGVEFVFGVDVVTGESSSRVASLPIIKEIRNTNKVVKAGEQVINSQEKAQKAVTKSQKAASSEKNAIIKRVTLRKSTVEKIKENQPLNKEGKPIDPNDQLPLGTDKTDIGHKTGQEWRTRKLVHKKNGSTRKEVIETENNPDLYQIERRSNNRSHKFEQKK